MITLEQMVLQILKLPVEQMMLVRTNIQHRDSNDTKSADMDIEIKRVGIVF